jgi:hypothetical protein
MLHPKQTKIMHMRMCFTSETSGRMELRCVLPRAPRGEQAAWPLGRIGPLGVWDLAQHPIPQGGADLPWLLVPECVGLQPALGGRRWSKGTTRVQAPDLCLQGGARL